MPDHASVKSYSLPARDLPLDDSWDVIVAGRGSAGSTAAGMAAAKAANSHSGKVRQVDRAELRSGLQKAGAYLPDLGVPSASNRLN
jgi:hypothetical protein